jgi:RNA polymerase sigma-70 factor, ECF subfamily
MTSRERFEVVYHQHAVAVKGYALRRADPARADDVVAEVFLVAWRRLDAVPAEPRPWLFGVARRVLANERRRAARQDAVVDRMGVPDCGGAHSADGAASAGGTLGAALAVLSDTDREALLLTAWEGLNHSEAALVLGVREATFTVRLHRARRRLARALERRQPTATSQTRVETQ